MVSILQHIAQKRCLLPPFIHTTAFGVGLWIAVTVAFHAPFLIYPGFGEQDAARIAITATYGSYVGHLTVDRQWAFSCPLYLSALYHVVDAGLAAPSELSRLMTLLSLAAGAFLVAALFVFVSRATGSRWVSHTTCLLCQLSPAHFFGSIYGFPTIVALFLFMAAALVFQHVAAMPLKKTTLAWGALFAGLYFAAVATKVDVVMASALLCLPIHQRWGLKRWRGLLWMGAMAIAAFVVFWLVNRYGLSMSKHETVAAHWESWTGQFFGGVETLFSRENAEIIGSATGLLTLPVAAAAIALMAARRILGRVVLWVGLTAFPIMIYWAAVSGNSARHNLIPAVFACVLAALPLRIDHRRFRIAWGAILVFMMAFNYFYYKPFHNPNNPSGRLIGSALILKGKVDGQVHRAKRIALRGGQRVLLAGVSHKHPFYYFEILACDRLTYVRKGGGKLVMREGDRERVFYFPVNKKEMTAKWARRNGYRFVRI